MVQKTAHKKEFWVKDFLQLDFSLTVTSENYLVDGLVEIGFGFGLMMDQNIEAHDGKSEKYLNCIVFIHHGEIDSKMRHFYQNIVD